MIRNEKPLKDIELGFVRKNDGKIINVKLFEIFRQFKTVDFINNEVVINGETLLANSFQNPYYESRLDVIKNTLNGGNGRYVINGTSYDINQLFNIEKGKAIDITIIPELNSRIESIVDELGNEYSTKEGVISVGMNENHTITILFNIIQ